MAVDSATYFIYICNFSRTHRNYWLIIINDTNTNRKSGRKEECLLFVGIYTEYSYMVSPFILKIIL